MKNNFNNGYKSNLLKQYNQLQKEKGAKHIEGNWYKGAVKCLCVYIL